MLAAKDTAQKINQAIHLLEEATHDEADQIKSRIKKNVEQSKGKLEGVYHRAEEFAKDHAKMLNDQVKQDPWKAIGVAAAIGAVSGYLISRNR